MYIYINESAVKTSITEIYPIIRLAFIKIYWFKYPLTCKFGHISWSMWLFHTSMWLWQWIQFLYLVFYVTWHKNPPRYYWKYLTRWSHRSIIWLHIISVQNICFQSRAAHWCLSRYWAYTNPPYQVW